MSLRAVSLWEAAVRIISRQQAVLQVNHRLANFLITSQEVIVIDRDLQVLVLGQETGHLKHPKQKHNNTFTIYTICSLLYAQFVHQLPSKHRVDGVGYVMISVFNCVPSQ